MNNQLRRERRLDPIHWVVKYRSSGEYLISCQLSSGGFCFATDKNLRKAYSFDSSGDAWDVAGAINSSGGSGNLRTCKVMRVRSKPIFY